MIESLPGNIDLVGFFEETTSLQNLARKLFPCNIFAKFSQEMRFKQGSCNIFFKDSKGNALHRKILETSWKKKNSLFPQSGL